MACFLSRQQCLSSWVSYRTLKLITWENVRWSLNNTSLQQRRGGNRYNLVARVRARVVGINNERGLGKPDNFVLCCLPLHFIFLGFCYTTGLHNVLVFDSLLVIWVGLNLRKSVAVPSVRRSDPHHWFVRYTRGIARSGFQDPKQGHEPLTKTDLPQATAGQNTLNWRVRPSLGEFID